jgi:hypothetical protein
VLALSNVVNVGKPFATRTASACTSTVSAAFRVTAQPANVAVGTCARPRDGLVLRYCGQGPVRAWAFHRLPRTFSPASSCLRVPDIFKLEVGAGDYEQWYLVDEWYPYNAGVEGRFQKNRVADRYNGTRHNTIFFPLDGVAANMDFTVTVGRKSNVTPGTTFRLLIYFGERHDMSEFGTVVHAGRVKYYEYYP